MNTLNLKKPFGQVFCYLKLALVEIHKEDLSNSFGVSEPGQVERSTSQ